MAEKAAKGGKKLVNRGKRHLQNVRTFMSVQKRREKHARNHGVAAESLGARRWTTPPTSKASNKMMA
jgi:hypothetical protein